MPLRFSLSQKRKSQNGSFYSKFFRSFRHNLLGTLPYEKINTPRDGKQFQ